MFVQSGLVQSAAASKGVVAKGRAGGEPKGDGARGQSQRQSSGMPDGTGPSKMRPEHLGQEEKLMGIYVKIKIKFIILYREEKMRKGGQRM